MRSRTLRAASLRMYQRWAYFSRLTGSARWHFNSMSERNAVWRFRLAIDRILDIHYGLEINCHWSTLLINARNETRQILWQRRFVCGFDVTELKGTSAIAMDYLGRSYRMLTDERFRERIMRCSADYRSLVDGEQSWH